MVAVEVFFGHSMLDITKVLLKSQGFSLSVQEDNPKSIHKFSMPAVSSYTLGADLRQFPMLL